MRPANSQETGDNRASVRRTSPRGRWCDASNIPCSRDNPKILWADEVEVVGDLIAVEIAVSGHVVAQEAQDRGAERLGGRVTPRPH
jgi:hypothetical protein